MSFRQAERFYCGSKDTVKNCPIGDYQTQIQQVQAKQTMAGSSFNSQDGSQDGGQDGGGATSLPYRWFSPECGCANCPARCPLRYGAQLDKASASGFLQNCGCGSGSQGQRGGCGCGGVSLEEQVGGSESQSGSGSQTGSGCGTKTQSGRCGCGAGALDEQLGGGPVGAPLYIRSPAYEQLYPNAQNTAAGGFPALKYNFTPTDGVQFVRY